LNSFNRYAILKLADHRTTAHRAAMLGNKSGAMREQPGNFFLKRFPPSGISNPKKNGHSVPWAEAAIYRPGNWHMASGARDAHQHYNGHSVPMAEPSASCQLAMPPIPSAAPSPARISWARRFALDFVSDLKAYGAKFWEYVRHPSHIAVDFKSVLSEVSGKYYASAAGLLIINTAVAEVAACGGRYAGFIGESLGPHGVASGILLGDHITAFAIGMIAWFVTTAKALGATTLKGKLSAFGKIAPLVVSTWARGFMLTLPFDVV